MRIFLCSTAYDLEDFRALIVHRHGVKHEIIHFEDAAFPARRGLHSHDQCIVGVNQADVVICIIDKRYGGLYAGNDKETFSPHKIIPNAAKKDKKEETIAVPANDLSISWCELITAFNKGKFVITFARQRTLDEKATRRKNKDVDDFKTAHVDNPRIFDLLDWITKQRKDNWIIPFTTIVDFDAKLEKWLKVAENSIVETDDKYPLENVKPIITVVTEGSFDARIVRTVIDAIQPNASINIIPDNGKRNILNNLEFYALAFSESHVVVIVLDADTVSLDEIKTQEQQFETKTASIEGVKFHLILTKPHIEEWLVSGLEEKDRLYSDSNVENVINQVQKNRENLLSYLRENLDDVRKSSDSLDEFVRVLTDTLSNTTKNNKMEDEIKQI